MKIYFADPEPNELKITQQILLSYYDIYISTIPFRKETWRLISETKKRYRKSARRSNKRH
jgi:hypothetical protein